MPNMTTTKNGFRVEDVTYRYARKQSEVANEIEKEEIPEEEIKAPVSLTPEQVMDFYKAKITKADDSNEKRLYSITIMWIKELLSTRKELISYKEKELLSDAEKETENIVEE